MQRIYSWNFEMPFKSSSLQTIVVIIACDFCCCCCKKCECVIAFVTHGSEIKCIFWNILLKQTNTSNQPSAVPEENRKITKRLFTALQLHDRTWRFYSIIYMFVCLNGCSLLCLFVVYVLLYSYSLAKELQNDADRQTDECTYTYV